LTVAAKAGAKQAIAGDCLAKTNAVMSGPEELALRHRCAAE
jgi:hypothetical protein